MPDLPLATTRPFRAADGLAAGLVTPGTLRGPRMRRLFRGVYLDADQPVDDVVRAEAALLVTPPGTVVARHTAAAMWGGIVPGDWRTHVTTFRPTVAQRTAAREERLPGRATGRGDPAGRRQLDGWRTEVDGLDARTSSDRSGVTTRRGLRITTPERTFLDCAEDLDLVDLVVLGDSLVHSGATTVDALIGAAATPGRHRRLARRAASCVRRGVDSAPETRTRMLMTLAGLPEPETDLHFADSAGRVLRRADMGYRRPKVSLEYDGRQHAEDPVQWAVDIDRREQFDGWGWRMVVITSPGLWSEPARTLDRVVTVLRSRGEHVGVRSEEWRRYFGPRHLRGA